MTRALVIAVIIVITAAGIRAAAFWWRRRKARIAWRKQSEKFSQVLYQAASQRLPFKKPPRH